MNEASTTEKGGDGPLVLLVGHCGADASMLRRAVREATPEARVQNVNSATKLNAAMDGARLLLVNRVLDGNFATGSGVELIGSLAQKANGDAAIMLISDYEDAQAQAEEAGAKPGFGKSALRSEETHRRIREALGAD